MKTRDMLKGMESQRLRTYCTSTCLEPQRDLDIYGRLLFEGDVSLVRADFEFRVAKYRDAAQPDPTACARRELAGLRWGPLSTPIYNVILLLTLMAPSRRPLLLEVARYLAHEARVPVDGVDMSGTTALAHAISTKPAFDPQYAEILFTAPGGDDVAHRNRYGGTAGHEMCQVYRVGDVPRAKDALAWYLSHGGNVDVKDTDGASARKTAETLGTRAGFRELLGVVKREDARRRERRNECCTFCGREDGGKLLTCSRCKTARYCDPARRRCQKADWARHKTDCGAQSSANAFLMMAAAAVSATFYYGGRS